MRIIDKCKSCGLGLECVCSKPPRPGMVRNFADTCWIDPVQIELDLDKALCKMDKAVVALKKCVEKDQFGTPESEAEALSALNILEN